MAKAAAEKGQQPLAGSLVAHKKADRETEVPRVAIEGKDGRPAAEKDDAAVFEFEKAALIGYVMIKLTIKGYVWHRYNPRRIDEEHLKELKSKMKIHIERYAEPVAALICRSDIADTVKPAPTPTDGDKTPKLVLKSTSKGAEIVMLSGQHRAKAMDELVAEEEESIKEGQREMERLKAKTKVVAGEDSVHDISAKLKDELSRSCSMPFWLCALYDKGEPSPDAPCFPSSSPTPHFPDVVLSQKSNRNRRLADLLILKLTRNINRPMKPETWYERVLIACKGLYPEHFGAGDPIGEERRKELLEIYDGRFPTPMVRSMYRDENISQALCAMITYSAIAATFKGVYQFEPHLQGTFGGVSSPSLLGENPTDASRTPATALDTGTQGYAEVHPVHLPRAGALRA